MGFKLAISLAAAVVVLAVFSVSEATPAYPGSTFNSWDTQPTPQQLQPQPQRRSSPGQKKTLQGLVRQHIDDLDKQTQSDLKVLGYLEKELNKIFSCYIKLSCARLRSPRVLSECEEIKDWPLYHQVMKMAGIRKYPYMNYAPLATMPVHVLSQTDLPEVSQSSDDDTTTDTIIPAAAGEDAAAFDSGNNDNEYDDQMAYQPQQRFNRQQQRYMRRMRRGSKTQQHPHQHHLTGVPVTNDDGQ